jgi:hypothetical protein
LNFIKPKRHVTADNLHPNAENISSRNLDVPATGAPRAGELDMIGMQAAIFNDRDKIAPRRQPPVIKNISFMRWFSTRPKVIMNSSSSTHHQLFGAHA